MRPFEDILADLRSAKRKRNAVRLKSLAEEFESIGTAAALTESYDARATVLAIENRNAESAELFNKVLETRTRNEDRFGIAQTNFDLGSVYNEYSEFDSALKCLQIALEIFQDLNYNYGVIGARSGIGINHFYRGLLQEALLFWEPALQMAIENDEQGFVASISLNIGNAMTRMGRYPSALEYYYRSLAITEHNDEMKNARALCYNNIGIIYYDTCCFADAAEWWSRAMDLYTEIGNDKMQAFVIENMGNLYHSNKDNARALKEYDKAIEVFERINARQPLANCYNAKAGVTFSEGDIDQSMIWRSKAIDLYESLGLTTSVIDAKVRMAQDLLNAKRIDDAKEIIDQLNDVKVDMMQTIIFLHDARGYLAELTSRPDEARAEYETMLRLSIDSGMRSGEAVAHQGLRDLAKAQGDIDAYIEHNDAFQKITEEVGGRDSALKLAMFEKQKEMQAIEQERERERSVLYSTLPKHIADRVIRGEVVNDHIDNAAVMFLDIVGFTTLSSSLTSQQVITLLDAVFKICDEACNLNNVVRIKTIGDSYLAVGGLEDEKTRGLEDEKTRGLEEEKTKGPVERIASAALHIIERVQSADFESLLVASSRFSSLPVAVRVGLHCGPVTAGVLGTERLQYDVWGDTVNVASRMESTSEPNRIHVTEQFALSLSPLSEKERGLGESSRESKGQGLGESSRESRGEGPGESSHETDSPLSTLRLTLRGLTEVKGKGPLTTYWLEAL